MTYRIVPCPKCNRLHGVIAVRSASRSGRAPDRSEQGERLADRMDRAQSEAPARSLTAGIPPPARSVTAGAERTRPRRVARALRVEGNPIRPSGGTPAA